MVAIEIFRLFGRILIDNDEANKSLAKTDKQAESVGNRFRSTIATAAKWGAGIAAAAAAGGASLLALSTKAAGTTDRIDKMSQKIGLSRQGFQEWDFILSQSGASVDGLQTGLRTLFRAADEAAQGTESYAEVFDRLNVSVVDANGNLKDQEILFNETVRALSNVENATERTALASQVLGRSATELAPVFNTSSDALEAMRAKAHELGLVIGDEAVDAGVLFTDTLDQVKRSFGTVVTEIGVSVMPMFQSFLDFVLEKIPMVAPVFEFIARVTAAVFKAIGQLIGVTVSFLRDNVIDPFIGWITTAWANNQEFLAETAGRVWDLIKTIFETAFSVIQSLWFAFRDAFSGDWEGAWSHIKDAAATLWNALPGIFESAMNLIRDVADRIMTAVIGVIRAMFGDEVAGIFQTAWDAVLLIWETAKENLLAVFRLLTAAFQGDWGTVLSELQGIAERTWTAITTAIEAALNGIVGLVRNILGGVANIVEAIFGENVANVVRMVFDKIVTLLEGARDLIFGVVQTIGNLFRGEWDAAFDSALATARGLWETLDTVFGDGVRAVIGWVSGLVESISEWLGDKLNAVLAPVQSVIDGISGAFGWLYDTLVGNSIIPDMVNEIDAAWQDLLRKLADGTGLTTTEVAAQFDQMGVDVGDATGDMVEDAKAKTSELENTWKSAVNSISSSVQSGMRTMFSAIQEGEPVFASLKAGIKDMVISIIETLQQQVIAVQIAETAKAIAMAPLSFGATLAAIPQIIAAIAPAIAGFEAAKAVIRGLARGGKIIGEGLAMVGERGPEILSMHNGSATVMPLDTGTVGQALASLVRPGPAPLGGMAMAGAGGFHTANITLEVDGERLAEVLGVRLVDTIRLQTGIRDA